MRARGAGCLDVLRRSAAGFALALCLPLLAAPAQANPALLRARHAELADALASSRLGEPLYIESRVADDTLHGQVYAVLDHRFAKVRDALRQPSNWCDIMILPFNSQYCHAVQTQGGAGLLVRIGRTPDQPLADTYRLLFDYDGVAASQEYFESRLSAPQGPFNTRDYNIEVSAIPLEGGRTFLRLDYSYAAGFLGRMALQAYLATAGADKVGFTRVEGENGQASNIAGVRGAVERNAMRYYLAIDAFLDSLDAPAARRVQQRIQNWFDATERYPRQLREMPRDEYVQLKRMQAERQKQLLR